MSNKPRSDDTRSTYAQNIYSKRYINEFIRWNSKYTCSDYLHLKTTKIHTVCITTWKIAIEIRNTILNHNAWNITTATTVPGAIRCTCSHTWNDYWHSRVRDFSNQKMQIELKKLLKQHNTKTNQAQITS